MAGSATWIADLVLLLHAAFVLFVVGGLFAIWVGHRCGWAFVDDPRFRVAHALAIGIVVAESWLGIACPLTVLEQVLRTQAGAPSLAAGEGFVAHWVGGLLFYDLPPLVFTIAYSVFGLAVLATWWRWPPRRAGERPADRR